MRLFIAISFPDVIRQGVWDAAGELRGAGFPIRWVGPEAVHLTLKFLGEVAPPREPEVVAGIERAVDGARPFTVPLGGFGAFPSVERPRVVWLGLEPVPPLELLQHRVERSMEEVGFPLESRQFRPHITLGRVHKGVWARELAGFAAVLERLRYAGESEVRSVVLMESELRREGARYTVRRSVELAA